MEEIIVFGKTSYAAIAKGLEKLDKSREEVEVEVIEEGSKGFLGFLGNKDAKILMRVKPTLEDNAKSFLDEMFKSMDMDVEVEAKEIDNRLEVDLKGDNMGLLIGRRGQTLDSLQYILSLVINKKSDRYVKVYLDTEDYRKKREETLHRLAFKMADKAVKTRRRVKLEPMNPFERRIIHSSLQNNKKIKTYSEGKEPFRKVVIEFKNDKKPSI